MPEGTDSTGITPEQTIDYDAFLSPASEDKPWCEQLAIRLRDEGVRVWFDAWELQPGDHLLVYLNDGLRRSRKLIAVWTHNYCHDAKVWTIAKVFSQPHPNLLAQERPIVSLLRDDCTPDIPPTLRNLFTIDCRRDDDFELHVRDLIQALNLPQRGNPGGGRRGPSGVSTPWTVPSVAVHRYEYGKRFENTVAGLYRLLGCEVTQASACE